MNSDSIFTKFKELYQAKNLPDCQNVFIKDGIISPTLFDSQKLRVLFIGKEHNYLGRSDDLDYKADYRKWWNCHVFLQFSHRISEWAHGILSDFSDDYDHLTYSQKHSALKSIAFINVKKASGNATSNPKVICDYISQSRDLLHQQITEIAPSHIVCCFRYDFYTEQLFGVKLNRAVTNTFSYGKWNNIKIINFYHPSSRKSKRLLYEQMAEAFRKLQTE